MDEEIAYSMKWLYAQKTDPGKRIESCEEYADMWNARPALLEVASNNGNAQKQLCDELQASRKYILDIIHVNKIKNPNIIDPTQLYMKNNTFFLLKRVVEKSVQ